MKTSDKTDMVSASMFAVQRDVSLPAKNTKGQTKGNRDYRYLNLPGLIDHLKPHLVQHQIAVVQEDVGDERSVAILTTVLHFSGQYLQLGPMVMPASPDPQDRGKVETYARRYSLAAAFNLAADEDTDAAPNAFSVAKSGGTTTPAAGPAVRGEANAGPVIIPGTDALASGQQWADLLALVDGKTREAVKLLDEANGTQYATYPNAKEGATWAELAKVLP